MQPTRQLAAILFSDLVGYTALMGKDSEKALTMVRMSKDIQKPLVEKHNGKWLKEMGDGAMAQFGSALDAVRCAIEIQGQARDRLDAKLRIGIHLGDITIENDDIYGDGVNVASRIEALAEPGGICISESVMNAVKGHDIQGMDMGEHALKNVDDPVHVYALAGPGMPAPKIRSQKKRRVRKRATIIAGIAVALTTAIYFVGSTLVFHDTGTATDQYNYDVAVMYLDNMTENEKYADQLVHLIHTNLADQEDLRVVSRQWIYDATKEISGEARNPNREEATAVARQVGVRTMLVGHVIQQNEDVQVQVELVDVNSGDILGSERVNGQMTSIFDLADLISRQINAPLQIETDYSVSDITTTSYDAFESYYAGMDDFWNYQFKDARDHFSEAIRQDSAFALAWMQYAIASNVYSPLDIYVDLRPQARMVQRALSLSSRLPQKEKLYVEGMHAMFNGDRETLFDITRKLVQIDEDDRFTYSLLGALQSHAQLRFHDSLLLEFVKRNPNSGFEVNSLAYRMAETGQYDIAKKALRTYIELEPRNYNPWHSAWEVNMILGDLGTALKYADTLARRFPDYRQWKGLSYFYGNLPEEAIRYYKEEQDLLDGHGREFITMAHNSYVLQGRFEKALSVIESQSELPVFADQSGTLFIKMQTAKALIWAGRYAEARIQLAQIINAAERLPSEHYSPMRFLGHFFLGILAGREGDEPGLEIQIQQLKKMLEEGSSDFRFAYYPSMLRGELALLRKDYHAVKAVLEDVHMQVMYPPIFARRLEYTYYWMTGDYDQAVETLSPFYNNVGSARWIYGGDQSFYAAELAFAPYWIGRILEDAGRFEEAQQSYEAFLDNFSESDSGIKEKEDAQERLAQLATSL